MEGQVIGFFESRSDVDEARNDLMAAGFNRSDIDTFEPGQAHDQGFMAKLKDFFGGAGGEQDRRIYEEASRRGEIALAVDIDDEREIDLASDILQRHNVVDLDQQVEQWRSQGWTGYQASMQPQATTQPQQTTGAQQEEVIPVTEEELRVGKREIRKGGIRVYSRVTEQPVQEDVQLREEHVQVERRPVDRPVQPGDQPFQERTIEASETAEEAVVSKQTRVKEEVALRKDVEQRTETVRDTLRHTDVEVEKLNPEQGATFSDDYANYLAGSEQYRGRDWSTAETDIRSDFERRYPGQRWDQFRDSIRSGYERRRQ